MCLRDLHLLEKGRIIKKKKDFTAVHLFLEILTIVTIFVSLWYNMVIVVRFTKDPNLQKTTKVLSILEVVV